MHAKFGLHFWFAFVSICFVVFDSCILTSLFVQTRQIRCRSMKCLSSSCGYACHTSGHAHHPTKGPVDFVGWCCGRCRLSDDYTHGPCCEQIRWASNLRELNEEVKRRQQLTPAQRHHEVTEAMMRGQLRWKSRPTLKKAMTAKGLKTQWPKLKKALTGSMTAKRKKKMQTNKGQSAMAKVKECTFEGD